MNLFKNRLTFLYSVHAAAEGGLTCFGESTMCTEKAPPEGILQGDCRPGSTHSRSGHCNFWFCLFVCLNSRPVGKTKSIHSVREN